MKRLSVLSVAIILSLVLSLAAAVPASAGQGNDDKVRVLVEFAPGHKGDMEKALNGIGAEFHFAFDDLNTFAVSVPAQALNGLERNPNVVSIEEDAIRYPISILPSQNAAPAAVSLPDQVVPYGVDMVQARDVWDVNRDGVVDADAPTASNRTICIIDSGIYTGHEDLNGVNADGYDGNLPWDTDGSGHGTHVSGTIAAMNNALGVIGVTPGTVNIYMVRVFGDDGAWAYSSTLADAANRCASAGANIISMSLGGSKSNRTEQNTFNNLYSQGILSIAAAGNEGTSALSYPASYTSVVSVAAIDENKVVADFSQFNSAVEVAAPGVAVLSTVPYLDNSSVTVDGVTYAGIQLEYAPDGSASGALVNGGLCATSGVWTGKVVLCERGEYDFYTKYMSAVNGGAVAVVIYNNVSGGFSGTLGQEVGGDVPGISISQEDGQYLVANKLGQTASVVGEIIAPASSYEYYDGTSMATPHASAVAALVWSAVPDATNVEIRNALTATAQDLGATGRDVYYGFGLVQAKAAIDYLTGGISPTPTATPVTPTPTPTITPTATPVTPTPTPDPDMSMFVADLLGTYTARGSKWTPKVTITVQDNTGALVSGVVVTGTLGTSTVSCTTGTAGTCSVSTSIKTNISSITYTVTNLAKTGYDYTPDFNVETSITITR
ncbi:MAG: S8 family serine peptidase [Anaerolineaceae bacterium]|nr:S8 family serine peptidase [Anaerolineaceae bacterium]